MVGELVFDPKLVLDLNPTSVGVFSCNRLAEGRCDLKDENGVYQCGACKDLDISLEEAYRLSREADIKGKLNTPVLSRLWGWVTGINQKLNTSGYWHREVAGLTLRKGNDITARVSVNAGKIVIAGGDIILD